MYNRSPNYLQLSISNFFGVGGGSNATAKFIRNQWQWADDIDWIRGRHHYRFGGEFIANQMDEVNVQFSTAIFVLTARKPGSTHQLAPQLQATDSRIIC